MLWSNGAEDTESNNDTIDTPVIAYIVESDDDVPSDSDSLYPESSSDEEKNTSSKTVSSDSDTDSAKETSTSSSAASTDSDSFEYLNKDMILYYEENPTPADAALPVENEFQSEIESSASTDSESYESFVSSYVESMTEESETVSEVNETNSNNNDNSDNDDFPSERILLDVPYYSQRSDMPTGCELVSAKMVLAYLGHTVSNQDIIDNLTRCDLGMDSYGRLYGKSPFDAFIGDPRYFTGFGCYPPVIENMVNNMGFSDITVCDTSYTSLDSLAETYLTQGFPIMTWVTIGLVDSYLGDSWYLTDENGNVTDEIYTWRAQEHCMVLVGYDENYYYFNDPLGTSGAMGYDRGLVERRYNEMGCYSLVLRNDL